MPEITIDISVYCSKCGRGLCNDTRVDGDRIYVDPCCDCMSRAEDEGYEKGIDDARTRDRTEELR